MTHTTAQAIDPVALLTAAGLPAPVAATRVPGGWDTELWRVTLPDGRSRALRVYRPGSDARAARREADALSALVGGGVPAPSVEAAGSFQSRPFLLLSWLRGGPMTDAVASRPWQLWRLGSAFGRLHARIHALPPPESAGGPRRWEEAAGDPALVEAVRAVAGPPVFCHGDFHPLNVMVAPSGVTGVIDLANVMAADRRADLGITETILLHAPLPPGPAKPLLHLLRGLFAHAWRAGYRARAGEFPLTPLFQAWGAASYLRGLEQAVAAGRGWATPEDAARLRRYIAERALAASVTPKPGSGGGL